MFAIVTDSTAYFTKEEALKRGIIIVPMTYTIGMHRYSEHYAEENEDFLNLINENLEICKTSQPNFMNYQDILEKLVETGAEVLCITISGRLSGAFNSALNVGKNISKRHIKVIDSKFTAGAQRLIIERALELREKNATLEQTFDECIKIRHKIGSVFSVENIDALRRSGRIGAVKQSISNVLNIKPILALKDGGVISIGIARGFNNLAKAMVDTMPENVEKVYLNYFIYTEALDILKNTIQEKYAAVKIENQILGPILAIHLGQEAFGIAWQEK